MPKSANHFVICSQKVLVFWSSPFLSRCHIQSPRTRDPIARSSVTAAALCPQSQPALSPHHSPLHLSSPRPKPSEAQQAAAHPAPLPGQATLPGEGPPLPGTFEELRREVAVLTIQSYWRAHRRRLRNAAQEAGAHTSAAPSRRQSASRRGVQEGSGAAAAGAPVRVPRLPVRAVSSVAEPSGEHPLLHTRLHSRAFVLLATPQEIWGYQKGTGGWTSCQLTQRGPPDCPSPVVVPARSGDTSLDLVSLCLILPHVISIEVLVFDVNRHLCGCMAIKDSRILVDVVGVKSLLPNEIA